MDETAFHVAADAVLTRLADAIDDQVGDRVDVELHAGILTMELEDGRQYVINKQTPNREIWVSSPFSGASHFRLDQGQWRSTRQAQVELCALLAQELAVSL